MKKFSLLLSLFVLGVSASFAQLDPQNTPDDYGYIWKDVSASYNWVDITSTGTQVTGLTDDNAIGPIQMGQNFKFYWNTYNKLFIGSNGYVCFSNTTIASNGQGNFPTMPATSAKDVIAPFMCDMSFDGPGNPGKVYTYSDIANKRFIISFENAAFWVNNASGYGGDNSYQIILHTDGDSITFQYKNQTGNWNSGYDASTAPMAIGISNSTGAYGLYVSQKIKPTANTATRFIAPLVPLISVTDAGPGYLQNPDNAGFFIKPGTPVSLNANIANTGNVDITSPTYVNAKIKTPAVSNPITYFNAFDTVASIVTNGSENITFAPDFNPPGLGGYAYEVTTTLSGDMNAGNNTSRIEMVVADTILSYTTYGTANSGISWTGGLGNSGGGVYYVPYQYPCVIKAIRTVLLPTQGNGTYAPPAGTPVYNLQVYDDTGLPGTLLADVAIDGADVLISNATNGFKINRHEIDPIIVASGGVYVGWIQQDDKIVLAAEDSALSSRRSMEILNNSWAPYRNAETTDLWLELVVEYLPNAIDPVGDIKDLVVFPNPSNGSVNVAATWEKSNNAAVKIYDINGRKVYLEFVNGTEYNKTLDLSHLAKGMYMLQIDTDKGTKTEKIVIE